MGELQTHSRGVLGLLADREDDGLHRDDLVAAGHQVDDGSAVFVEVEALDLLELDALGLLLAGDAQEGVGRVEDDALFGAFLDLILGGGHLLRVFEAGDVDVLRAESESRSRAVVGDRAAAEDHDVLADRHRITHSGGPQEGRVDVNVLEVVAGDRQLGAEVGADADQHRVIAAVQQLRGSGRCGIRPDLDAGVVNHLELLVQHLVGHPVDRDAVAALTAELRQLLEHGDRVALAGKVQGGRQARRSAADDGGLLAGGRVLADAGFPFAGVVDAGSSLQLADGDGRAQLLVLALGLAGMGADAAEDLREGHALADDRGGLFILAVLDIADKSGDVDVGRAGGAAGHDVVGLGALLLHDLDLIDDGAGGTDLDAGPAEAAAGLFEALPVGDAGADAGVGLDVVQHLDPAQILAGPDAAAAADAAGEQVGDQGV